MLKEHLEIVILNNSITDKKTYEILNSIVFQKIFKSIKKTI